MYDKISWLYSFRGRLNRAAYWKVFLVLAAIWLVLDLLMLFGGRFAFAWLRFFTLAYLLFGIPVYLSIAARRLHDRNKSGWWLILFVLAPALIDIGSNQLGLVVTERPWSDLMSVSVSLSWIFALWGAVELKILKGSDGANRFGDDPLAQHEPAVTSF
jgi:uncharacterized membrane protein YhaH (DUF805 family)